MRKFLSVFIPIVFCFLIGFTASFYELDALSGWYPFLKKPQFPFSNMVFPLMWSVLNIVIGISIGLVVYERGRNDLFLIRLFIVIMLTRLLWSVIFFYFRCPLGGFISFIVLDVLSIYYIIKCYPANKVSSFLFMVYFAWLLFITYLVGYILLYN
ncbi:MAG: tryptophan-rich sensory protein [Tannerellaceae bacterium]|nr:tryptophan-rich sensory protein [Tannerellaceae bacterium]